MRINSTMALLGALTVAFLLGGCAGKSAAVPSAATMYNAQRLPPGKMGALIRYGQQLIVDTPKYMKPNITANMSCAACHVSGGLVARGGTFIGIAGTFPQYNKRSKRAITLSDRLAECFLYSMNGTPPAYTSREMEAMVAYITYISRGAKVWSKPNAATRIAQLKSTAPPNLVVGAQIYSQKCSVCHQANGAGRTGKFPPLWGSTSFNTGAGMAHLPMMAGFVRYNMPQTAPGSLTDAQALDVAAFVLSHKRPIFDKTRLISYPALPASFY